MNLASLCNGCHQTLHRIALLLASTKSGKESPEQQAIEYARAVNPDVWGAVKRALLDLAVQVAVAISSKRNGLIAVQDSDLLIPEIPPKMKKLLIELGKEVKSGSKRGIGASGVALVAVLDYLANRRPGIRNDVNAFLQQRFGMTSQQARAHRQAEQVKASLQINLKSHAPGLDA